jgi:hypothetical protein
MWRDHFDYPRGAAFIRTDVAPKEQERAAPVALEIFGKSSEE